MELLFIHYMLNGRMPSDEEMSLYIFFLLSGIVLSLLIIGSIKPKAGKDEVNSKVVDKAIVRPKSKKKARRRRKK